MSSIPINSIRVSSQTRRLVTRDVSRIGLSFYALIPNWAWLIPLLGFCTLFAATGPLLPWFVGKYALTGKDCQEIVGPMILLAATVLAFYQTFVRPCLFHVWISATPAVLLCREIHFRGTSTGVFVGLALVALSVHRFSSIQRGFNNSAALRGCWFGAATLYILALSLDAGAWKWLPHARWWGVNLEETLESCGHATILIGVFAAGQLSKMSGHTCQSEPRCVSTRTGLATSKRSGHGVPGLLNNASDC